MEKLDLNKCTTNAQVCKLVTGRINEISYRDLLIEVDKRFVYQSKATRAIYTGLLMNMNVFLSGPGGYGKSALIKYVLDIYKIPYHSIIGYKDMPVDALLGIPNMDKLIKESKYELNFKDSIFCKPGILIGEEFTDILPSTAAALKDILTERGFRNKDGKVESLVSTMIIAANKSAKEVIDDESKRAFYEERFPLQVEVKWNTYTSKDYYALLKLTYPEVQKAMLYFMAKLFATNHEEFSNTVSPRVALNITDVYLNKGISFIDNFAINTDTIKNIQEIAKQEFNKKSVQKLLTELEQIVEGLRGKNDYRLSVLYIEKKLSMLKVTDDLLMPVVNTKNNITNISGSRDFSTILFKQIDEIFRQINND